jgi:hypothetical protein
MTLAVHSCAFSSAASANSLFMWLVLSYQVQKEKKSLKPSGEENTDVEACWRRLVHNMEAWNRIVMNLELSALKVVS